MSPQHTDCGIVACATPAERSPPNAPLRRNAFDVLTRAPARAAAAAARELRRSDGLAYLMGTTRKRARDSEAAAVAANAAPEWLAPPRTGAGGRVHVWALPYSEHSSCAELREFVRWLRPVAVVPTVGRGDGGSKVAAMLHTLAA